MDSVMPIFIKSDNKEEFPLPLMLDKDFYTEWLQRDDNVFSETESIVLSLGIHPNLVASVNLGTKVKKQAELIKSDIVYKSLTGGNKKISPIEIVRIAFQYEQKIPDYVINAYKTKTGEDLKYEDYSPVKQFYKKWGKYDLWTLHQAICLISGMSPDIEEYYPSPSSRNTKIRHC
jgi:hypothetical protein